MVARRSIPVLLLLAAAGPGCRQVAPRPVDPVETAAALEQRSLAAPALRDLLARHLAAPPERWPLERWGLEELTLAALLFQPELGVARASAAVARAHVGAAGQRPNPTLSVLPQRVSNPAAGISPWLAAAQIDWPIETAGKRGYRIDAARARAGAARLGIRTEAWRLRRRVYEAVVKLVAARRSRAAAVRLRAAQERLVALFEDRLARGAISRAELEPQRLALVRARAELAAAERRSLEARAALAAAVGVPRAALDRVRVVFPLASVPPGLAEVTAAAARRAALIGRSDVRALLDEYAAAESDLRLELAKQVPDLHLGPAYEFDQGANKWGLALSVELPLLSRNQGGIDEAQARRAEVAVRFEALQARVIAEVEAASARLRGAEVERSEARRLVEVARRRRQLARAALERGAADRAAVLGAEVELGAAETALVGAEERLHLAAAALEQAVQPKRRFLAALGLGSAGTSGAARARSPERAPGRALQRPSVRPAEAFREDDVR